jgi:hypothetical protein
MPTITKNLVFSALFAGAGMAFLYYASVGETRLVLHLVLFRVGCAFSCFSLSIQPSALFDRVKRRGLTVEIPKLSGYASALNILSAVFMSLAALAWLLA